MLQMRGTVGKKLGKAWRVGEIVFLENINQYVVKKHHAFPRGIALEFSPISWLTAAEIVV